MARRALARAADRRTPTVPGPFALLDDRLIGLGAARRAPRRRRLAVLGAAARLIALALLLFVAVRSVAPQLADADLSTLLEPSLGTGDGVSDVEARFLAVRDGLPDEPLLGYATDVENVGIFYLAQYALGPRLLVPIRPIPGLDHLPPGAASAAPRWVLGVYRTPDALRADLDDLELELEEALGKGTFLLRRREAPSP